MKERHRLAVPRASARVSSARASPIVRASLAILVSAASCARGAPSTPEPLPMPVESPLKARARGLVAMMSDEELVGQVMMIDAEGSASLSEASRAVLETVRPGAVLLFGYNVAAGPASTASLTKSIRSAAGSGGLPPFIAIDHEGGSVYRFKGGLTRLPSAKALGLAGPRAARAAGRAAGSELRALGIAMNLAPVVEALSDDNASFLADRAWSEDPSVSGRLAAGFIEACQDGGTAAVAKHFPGNAATDPHLGLPVIRASLEAVEASLLPPFRIAARAGVSAIMLSHAVVVALDPDLPASLSPRVVSALKDGLGFDGIVMTDDLSMRALSAYGGLGAVGPAALAAGADLVMVSGGRDALAIREALLEALGHGALSRERLRDAASRVVEQKLRFGLDSETDDERAARFDALAGTVAAGTAALKEARESARESARGGPRDRLDP
ncbi:MAG: hypothetical protein KKA67_15855 [Spirochaetes bacterium]|nr:hypothetical protein [Spirochaetota bacterium]MBU1080043.1 hypothetical protein [Spirochaetota bacterium]